MDVLWTSVLASSLAAFVQCLQYHFTTSVPVSTVSGKEHVIPEISTTPKACELTSISRDWKSLRRSVCCSVFSYLVHSQRSAEQIGPWPRIFSLAKTIGLSGLKDFKRVSKDY